MAEPRVDRVIDRDTLRDVASPPGPDRWQRVHEALQSTVDLEPSARDGYLEQIGRQDPDLQREVASLLAAAETHGVFDELVDRFVVSEPTERLPRRIGAYRPVRLLGRGGMGAVYLAERADGAYHQRVALKLLPAGTRPDLHARFLTERRILARLEHPNIARLLDGGTTDDGLPYVVLEYVDGEPLTTYCDRLRLPIEARLRLFLDVCTAVGWAHKNLIVHRDIKPANVLVESGGEGRGPRIKLLDFGIAKLLNDEFSTAGSAVTRADLRLLTPDYAAPEQVRNDPVTTATDVYQLGVLLYELLSGRRPHRLTSRALHIIEREICERDPACPSLALAHAGVDAVSTARSTTPRRLTRALAGDLDTIVMHALAREPERRYGSPVALAADVRRHLDGMPVEARPDSLAYRAGKFVRRHRAGVLAGGVIAALLCAAVVAISVQNARIDTQRLRAERAAGFLAELFEDLEPVQARGSAVDPRAILDVAAGRVSAEMSDQPLLQAQLFDVLGRVYQMRGFFAEAEPLLREALALRVQLLGAGHADVADSRYTLAQLLAETDRHVEGEPLLAAAVAALRAQLGPAHPRVASIQVEQALARRAAGDLPAADSILAVAIIVLRTVSDEPLDLATALLYRGKVHIERGDAIGAEPMILEALDIRRDRFGNEHPTVANAVDGVGEMWQARGDLAGAEHAFREALAIRRALFPSDHPDVAVSFENLGIVLHKLGRNREALALLDSALASLRPTFGDEHPLVTIAVAYQDSARR